MGKTYRPYNAGDFNHMDFVYGMYASDFYGEIINIFSKQRKQSVSTKASSK